MSCVTYSNKLPPHPLPSLPVHCLQQATYKFRLFKAKVKKLFAAHLERLFVHNEATKSISNPQLDSTTHQCTECRSNFFNNQCQRHP